MSSHKRRIDDEIDAEEANASDPEDSDFELHTPRKRTRSSRPTAPSSARKKQKSSARSRRQGGRNKELSQQRKKRSRPQRYGDEDEEDEESDEDEGLDSDAGEASFGANSSEEEESEELNPSTGRAIRKTAAKKVNYNLSDEDDVEGEEEVEEKEEKGGRSAKRVNSRLTQSISRKGKAQVKKEDVFDDEIEGESEASDAIPQKGRRTSDSSSLVLKLKVPNLEAIFATRRRQPSKQAEMHHTRRQSRVSNEEPEFLSLTNSGNHVERRASTHSPEIDPLPRPTRASKGVKKPISAIMEASQENSQGMQATETGSLGNDDSKDDDEDEDGKEKKKLTSGAKNADEEDDDAAQVQSSDKNRVQSQDEIQMEDPQNEDEDEGNAGVGVIQESVHGDDEDGDGEEDNDDGAPVLRHGRTTRSTGRKAPAVPTPAPTTGKRSKGVEESSDFDPNAEKSSEEENMSGSNAGDDDDDEDQPPSRKRRRMNRDDEDEDENDDNVKASRELRSSLRARSSQRSRRRQSDEHLSLDSDELAEEADELNQENYSSRRKRRHTLNISYERPKRQRAQTNVDYRIFKPENLQTNDDEEDIDVAATSRRRGRAAGTSYRSLFSTQGPFGGAAGLPSLITGGEGALAAGGAADSDSSDDEAARIVKGTAGAYGGTVGMTPTSAHPHALVPQQPLGSDPVQPPSGSGPANFGKVKDKKALADSDPLGVDQTVNFEGVGGLDEHINQLKEMVMLPLLYPELFQRFHITPPRGVLFHGPPGTGKTLLARALASSVSSNGRKVTFYMRKGADALSKWVGEAERQLRLLFDEARKTQPSIIFFDEIDGLAPVRSSKQEQIHASIVATLLALMDGMDGRGQVIIIGATNRPDSVDPALRRPGRFDREFYFPLPNVAARNAIIDIHTKGWEPPLKPQFKDQLAELTKGYGGADLRALCTEAALNAVQGTFPQIYQSTEKLIVDPTQIKVLAKDFMISVNKIVPSSERSAAVASTPVDKSVEPLLRTALRDIGKMLDEILPRPKKLTALEEAQYDDRNEMGNNDEDGSRGFDRETMQRAFDHSRVFRPRLLIHGMQGMGQQYISSTLLGKLEGLYVQSFDISVLVADTPATSIDAVMVSLFKEVRRHKPSVIYIPNVDVWYETVGESAIKTFKSLLRTIPPNDPVLVLGDMENGSDEDRPDPEMLRDLFGFSTKSQFKLRRPDQEARSEFFAPIIDYIRMIPTNFPNRENRKKRELPKLKVAPSPKALPPSKEELKAQKKKDRHTLNLLKLHIQPVMDQIKLKHKRFRAPIIDEKSIRYLFEEQNPDVVTTDLPLEEQKRQNQQLFRPFELSKDNKGNPGLLEVATDKFYYNLDTVTMEKRLSNGYYKRPKDFLADIKTLAKDARTAGDPERTLKANELVANVEVDMTMVEQNTALVTECEAVYARELERERQAMAKAAQGGRQGGDGKAAGGGGRDQHTTMMLESDLMLPPQQDGHNTTITTTDQSSGPVMLGEAVPGTKNLPAVMSSSMAGAGTGTSGAGAIAGNVNLPGGPGPSPLSNGVSAADGDDSGPRQSNGSTVPSRPAYEDIPMPDSQDAYADASGSGSAPDQHQHQHNRPVRTHSVTTPQHAGQSNSSPPDQMQVQQQQQQQGLQGSNPSANINPISTPETPSAPNTQTQRSQISALTQMAQGSQAVDYHNSASTTTSGQKTSDRSHRSSGPQYGTQSIGANSGNSGNSGPAKSEHPDLSAMMPMGGGSQLPDTQELYHSSQTTNSQPSQSSPSFQRPAIPPHNMMRLLNPTDPSASAKAGSLSSAAATAAATAGSTNNRSSMTNPPPLFSTPPNNRGTTVTAANKNNANANANANAIAVTANKATGDASSTTTATTKHNKQNGVKPDDGGGPPSSAAVHPHPHPQPLLDEALFKRVHTSLIHHSSGLSVEQLEQVNSAIMTTVWKTRMEWNRVVVAKAVEMAFNEVIEDITAMQKILPSSQEQQQQLEREREKMAQEGQQSQQGQWQRRRKRVGSMAESSEGLGRSVGGGGGGGNDSGVAGGAGAGNSSVAAAGTEAGLGGSVVGPPAGGGGVGGTELGV